MQFINYIPPINFFQQLLIEAPKLFRRFSHAYICLDIYPEIVGVATFEVLFGLRVSVMTIFIIEITEYTLLVK